MVSSVGTIRRATASAIAATLMTGLVLTLAPSSVSAGRGIHISAWLGSSCVEGRVNDRQSLTVAWRDDDGSMKQKGRLRADAMGYWMLCGDGNEMVTKGDTITVKIARKSRTVTVPKLKLAIDRVADDVSGKAPASSKIVVEACRYTTYSARDCALRNVTVKPDGTFDVSFGVDLKGRDIVRIYYLGAKLAFIREQDVPYIAVAEDKARFWGYFRPFRMVEVELRDGGGAVKDTWKGRADDWDWGFFRGRFADADGHLVKARAGDRVIVPVLGTDADWVVPNMKVNTFKRTDVVTGRCGLPGAYFQLRAWSPDWSKDGRVVGRTSAAGTFRKDMTRRINLKTGYVVWLSCMLPTGDLVETRAIVD